MPAKVASLGLLLAVCALAGSLYVIETLVRLHGLSLVLALIAWALVLALVTINVLRLRRRLHLLVDRFGAGGWIAVTFTQLGPIIILGAWLLPIGALLLDALMRD